MPTTIILQSKFCPDYECFGFKRRVKNCTEYVGACHGAGFSSIVWSEDDGETRLRGLIRLPEHQIGIGFRIASRQSICMEPDGGRIGYQKRRRFIILLLVLVIVSQKQADGRLLKGKVLM